jgi:integrase
MANINGSRKRGYKEGGLIKPANSPYWYTLVRIDGKQIRRATDLRHTEGGREVNRKAAQDVLREIVTRARFSDSSAVLNRERLTYEEMRGDYLNFYESKKRKSLKTRKEDGQHGGKEGELFVCGLNHLDEFFAGRTAIQISNDDVSRFVRQMQKDYQLSGATVNRSLAALRKMFNLARDRKKILVTDGPNIKIEMLPEPESRKGFITHKEFLRLMGKDEKGNYLLLDHVRALAFVAYNTGMRKGELLNLRWANVNLDEGFIRLKPAETKNGKARLIPLDEETLALLTKLDPFHPADHYVFQGRKKEGNKWMRSGERIQDASFNKVWNAACARHNIVQSTEDGEVISHVEPDGTYVGLIPHDLRRSYVRSIDNSGVPASLGQKITGHLDAAVYEQYNQKHQSDLRSAAQKRAEYLLQAV